MEELDEKNIELPLKTLKNIIQQLSNAVNHMHECGIVHRDLNPKNVFLCFEYLNPTQKFDLSAATVKIIDFNVSKMECKNENFEMSVSMMSNTQIQNLKLSSNRIGTPLYRAPELWTMLGTYTKAVDLWGIGCVVYALAVGQDAFKPCLDLGKNIRTGNYDKSCDRF